VDPPDLINWGRWLPQRLWGCSLLLPLLPLLYTWCVEQAVLAEVTVRVKSYKPGLAWVSRISWMLNRSDSALPAAAAVSWFALWLMYDVNQQTTSQLSADCGGPGNDTVIGTCNRRIW
jgi:hypothetical protein